MVEKAKVEMVSGNEVIAKSLAYQGVTHVFGIVGIPIIDLGFWVQGEDMNYFGFRNEQAMSYAAGVVGYLTKRPGVCMAVSGPGMTNCISGMANALINKWPMICLGGAPDSTLEGQGAFQEYDQLAAAKPNCKYAARPNSVEHIPIIIERAVRMSMYGTPGPCYIDLPMNLLYASVPAS
jgi:2-hydroxyacyl-CoA lyase 1